MKFLFSIVFITLSLFLKAQEDFLKHNEHYKEHLSLKDTFFGSEDDFMVCYPKSHRNLFTIIILLGTATVISICYALIIQRKSNKKLSSINRIIEEKKDDIISSINYSKRIQDAMLPHLPDCINKNNSLIIYKPKDIVSGDTYWIEESGHHKIFIIADCTGHGVPGALLSMLVSTAIQKAIFETKDLSPTTILDNINDQIKFSLKQNSPSAIQDSVDMGVVILNTITHKLEFSGANSNLFLIQNNQVNFIKGSKCTVGSVQDHVSEKPSTLEFTVNKNDAFVLYTDGIVDQIGGDKNEKLKRKGLNKILMEAIKSDFLSYLKTQLDLWINNKEQVDDITLISYKIL